MLRSSLILRLAGVAGITLALAAPAACGGDDTSSEDMARPGTAAARLNVATTTVQITALAKEVGGELVALHGLVPAGADAHDFEPTASDLVAIEEADLILRHGIGLDEWLDDTVEAGSSATVATVTAGIELHKPALEQAGGAEENAGEHAGEEGLDPHVWHDPGRAKVMVDNIAAALVSADPSNAAAYQANAGAYNQELDGAKAQIQAIIDEIPVENRKLVTNHDAFGYFAEAFGLEIVGAVIPGATTEAEPSAGETAELLETIEREGVKAIFAESSVNPQLATSLANDAGVKIVDDLYGDSLGEPGSGADTVDGMLLVNAHKIAGALR